MTKGFFFSFFPQTIRGLFQENFTKLKNLVIIVGHWILHAYGIIAITQLTKPEFHASLLVLTIFPTIFYIVTCKFSDPYFIDQAFSSWKIFSLLKACLFFLVFNSFQIWNDSWIIAKKYPYLYHAGFHHKVLVCVFFWFSRLIIHLLTSQKEASRTIYIYCSFYQ